MPAPFDTCSLFGVPVVRATSDDIVEFVLAAVRSREADVRRIGYVNAHTANLAWEDAEYRRALAGFDVVYADGMGAVRACARRGRPLPGRVNAGDFLVRFLWACRDGNVRVALVGSRPEVVEQCRRDLEARIPGFSFCFAHHGHFAPGGAEERETLELLRASRPDVVLAGMGSPKQEYWSRDHAHRTGAHVVWCVGALFEYFAGRGRAPVWMRELGLEWFYRLVLEPRRLAARYIVGNAKFAWRALRSSR